MVRRPQRPRAARSGRRLAVSLAPLILLVASACAPADGRASSDAPPAAAPSSPAPAAPAAPAAHPAGGGRAVATFAMGCFWCAEDAFEAVDGVRSVVSGYTGGKEKNPTYEQVSGHRTGHYEAIEVAYDPRQVSYEQLLAIFWHNVDPFDGGGQFCDRGAQYRAAVFTHDEGQRQLAEASKERFARQLGKRVATEILSAAPFYVAEEYHQDYAQKNPLRYRFYRNGCGRDARLRTVWGDAAGGH